MTTNGTPPRYPYATLARTYIRRLTLDDLLALQEEFTRPSRFEVRFALLVQRQVEAMRYDAAGMNRS